MTNRPISPPQSKRRRLAETPSATKATPSPALAPSLPSRPITPLQPSQIRIFSWNINGISPFLQPAITAFFPSTNSKASHTKPHSRESSPHPPALSLRACLKRWKWPHIVCLQEVKIPRQDTKTQQAVRHAVKAPQHGVGVDVEREAGYTAHFSLPRDRFNARGFGGKVYGVCTLVRDDLWAHEQEDAEDLVKEVLWDLEGRVLVTEMPSRKVVVFNVYAVNGTDNPYRATLTGEVVGTRHDRKRVFHSALKRECEVYEVKGWAVVIAGDMNVARSALDGFPGRRMGEEHVTNRKDFEENFMEVRERGGLEMVDTYRALHGEERKYSYRGRGGEWGSSCDRVDLILLSRSAFARERGGLAEADILDEEAERGPSDHLPLYITIDIDLIHSDQTCTLKHCMLLTQG